MNQTKPENELACQREPCGMFSNSGSKLSSIPNAVETCANSQRISPLDEALRLTRGARQSSYGHPMEDFSRTGALWTSLLSLPPGTIDAQKVAMMMVLLKLSRQMHKNTRDNLVDAAGYINCLDMVLERLELRVPFQGKIGSLSPAAGIGRPETLQEAAARFKRATEQTPQEYAKWVEDTIINPVHDMGSKC